MIQIIFLIVYLIYRLYIYISNLKFPTGVGCYISAFPLGWCTLDLYEGLLLHTHSLLTTLLFNPFTTYIY